MTDIKLNEKVAVVTGASQGLGRAIALELAASGCKVLGVARNAGKLQTLCADIEKSGGHAASLAVDICHEQAPAKIVEAIAQQFGHVDILVNAAGVFVWKDFLKLEKEDWQKTLALNLIAPCHLTQAIANHMVSQKRQGSVINITSIHGNTPDANVVPHCTAKFGLEGLTRASAEALRPHQIRVNAIAPGAIASESADRYSGSIAEKVTQKDIASFAVYLASDLAHAVTGTTIEMFGETHRKIK